MLGTILLAATLVQNAIAITNAAAEIDAAIVAKGGTTIGGLTNAAAAISAIPTGGEVKMPYIRGNGSAITLTDVFTASDLTFELSFVCENSGYCTPFGGRVTSNSSDIQFYQQGYIYSCRFGNQSTNLARPVGKNIITFNKTSLSVHDMNRNMLLSCVFSGGTINDPRKIAIFGLNNNGSLTQGLIGRIYWFKITNGNDEVLGDFRPAKQNNVAGFLDSVSGNFYPSATSTPFTYGEDE